MKPMETISQQMRGAGHCRLRAQAKGGRGMWALGRREFATALLLRPVLPFYNSLRYSPLLERGRERESVRGSIALFKENDA